MTDEPTIRVCTEHSRPVLSASARTCSINYWHPPTECRVVTLRRRPVHDEFEEGLEVELDYIWTEEP